MAWASLRLHCGTLRNGERRKSWAGRSGQMPSPLASSARLCAFSGRPVPWYPAPCGRGRAIISAGLRSRIFRRIGRMQQLCRQQVGEHLVQPHRRRLFQPEAHST